MIRRWRRWSWWAALASRCPCRPDPLVDPGPFGQIPEGRSAPGGPGRGGTRRRPPGPSLISTRSPWPATSRAAPAGGAAARRRDEEGPRSGARPNRSSVADMSSIVRVPEPGSAAKRRTGLDAVARDELRKSLATRRARRRRGSRTTPRRGTGRRHREAPEVPVPTGATATYDPSGTPSGLTETMSSRCRHWSRVPEQVDEAELAAAVPSHERLDLLAA